MKSYTSILQLTDLLAKWFCGIWLIRESFISFAAMSREVMVCWNDLLDQIFIDRFLHTLLVASFSHSWSVVISIPMHYFRHCRKMSALMLNQQNCTSPPAKVFVISSQKHMNAFFESFLGREFSKGCLKLSNGVGHVHISLSSHFSRDVVCLNTSTWMSRLSIVSRYQCSRGMDVPK